MINKKDPLIFIYNLFLPFVTNFLPILSIFNKKINEFLTVRKNEKEKLIKFKKNLKQNEKTIWFHASSLGEYEQAKPIINKIRDYDSSIKIVVSFFSTSGYDYASDKNGFFDMKFYLPVDTYMNAELIINFIKPKLVIFLGYDVWPNLITSLYNHSIPSYLINATMRENSMRCNKFLTPFFYSIYNKLKKIYVVSEVMRNRYDKICESSKIEIVGDSRFDSVVQRKSQVNLNHLKKLFSNKFVLIIGSSHPDDENVLIKSLREIYQTAVDLLIIFAPHNVSRENINRLIRNFEKENMSYLKYTDFQNNNIYDNENILLIDTIGKLFSLYSLGNIAYIGGSFKEGIHNVMEPAVFGVPVLSGHLYNNSNEAVEMKNLNLLFPIKSSEEFVEGFKKLYIEKEQLNSYKDKIINYVNSKTGSADYIFENIIKRGKNDR